ncbi:SusD/RagB family nutrient-binding outer membrane lipoprotein [Sphingobacterium olei]|nr:SusD/RagB family nutrient-binding outer membrane lipoprotein [Sphingobacterium olei]
MKKIKNIIVIALLAGLASCSKHFDINDNPNDPTSLQESALLPRIQKYLGFALGMGGDTDDLNVSKGGFGTNLSAYMHQMSHYGNADDYGAQANDYYWSQGWNISYRDVLTNLNSIIEQGVSNDNLRYVGIAKIMKAYTYSVLVDLYGDVPFSEANQSVGGILYPKYDSGSEIYPQLFTLLEEGIADLQNTDATNLSVPSTDDVIYGGNATNWVRAANSIKLKLLVQQRKIKDVSAEVNALLANPSDLISSTEQSFMIRYGKNEATDDRNPGFSEYFATQRTMHPSPWLYEIMKGYNSNILTGIEDPRTPYYFYNQIKANAAANPIVEYRDGGFVSKYFGSQGTNRGSNVQNIVSLFGIYPVGGRYDDGQGGTANANSGTGAAPYRLITYADILYLQAELINESVISGNADEVLEAAVKESFKMVDYVVANNGSSQTIPALSGTAAETTYIDALLVKFNSASAAKKLEYIMTEKWLSSVGTWIDQYNDYRRTGYPILFAPNGTVTPPAGGNGGDDLPAVPVSSSRGFPLSLPYISDEINTNPNAPQQKTDLTSAKVFWMP